MTKPKQKKRAHGHRWEYVALGHRRCTVKGCAVEQRWAAGTRGDVESLIVGFRDETGRLANDVRQPLPGSAAE